MFQTNAISKHTVTRSLPVTRVCPAGSPLDRRGALLGIVGLIATTTATEAALAADEFGYAGDAGTETLNTCSMNLPSCVSTLNDDEAHFAAPWEFDGSLEDAVAQLCRVVEGGDYAAAVTGVSNLDAAGYIAKTTIAVAMDPFPKEKGNLPERPKVRRAAADSIVRFKGKVTAKEVTPGGSTYVRCRVEGGDDPSETIDAEFLFLANDSIVNVRAVSAVQPEEGKGKLALSMTQGFVRDSNKAREQMESLRRALGWNLAVVLTDFDPKFNAEVPTVVERIFNPLSDFKPSGIPYPSE